jgi:Spy/CpxP family protein refolding chaperone
MINLFYKERKIMVKKTTIGILVGVLLLVTAGAIVYARAGSFVPGLMLDGMKARMIENLELTTGQVDSIEAIIEEIKAEIPDMREHHRGIHDEFARQFTNDTFDQEAIKTTLEEKLVELKGMTDFMITKVSEFHAILTPEQREKLVEHMREIKENRYSGFGHGPRHGQCPWSK